MSCKEPISNQQNACRLKNCDANLQNCDKEILKYLELLIHVTVYVIYSHFFRQ